MGDAAELALDAMEAGESLVWFPELQEVRSIANSDLMYVSMRCGVILENCNAKILQQIAKKYGIRGKATYKKVRNFFDP